jgi:hypothetical protein
MALRAAADCFLAKTGVHFNKMGLIFVAILLDGDQFQLDLCTLGNL